MDDFDTRMRKAWLSRPDRDHQRISGFLGLVAGIAVGWLAHQMLPDSPLSVSVIIGLVAASAAIAILRKRPRLTSYVLLFLLIGVVAAIIRIGDG